jgi:hypothetical protein
MPKAAKSAIVIIFLAFVMLLVLDADIKRRSLIGDPCTGTCALRMRRISFCDGWVGELPVLEALPCLAVDAVVCLALFAGMVAFGLIVKAGGRRQVE